MSEGPAYIPGASGGFSLHAFYEGIAAVLSASPEAKAKLEKLKADILHKNYHAVEDDLKDLETFLKKLPKDLADFRSEIDQAVNTTIANYHVFLEPGNLKFDPGFDPKDPVHLSFDWNYPDNAPGEISHLPSDLRDKIDILELDREAGKITYTDPRTGLTYEITKAAAHGLLPYGKLTFKVSGSFEDFEKAGYQAVFEPTAGPGSLNPLEQLLAKFDI